MERGRACIAAEAEISPDPPGRVPKPFGIKEQTRTGAVFTSRWAKVLNQSPDSVSDRKYLAG